MIVYLSVHSYCTIKNLNMLKLISILFVILLSLGSSLAQDTNRKISFPDVQGYHTLKVDLHIHTVFSDGRVWPTIRVDEAVRDGLDAIALTEHIEYQPWNADIKHDDRNRSYELAKQAAKPFDLIVIHGTEITRGLPPGHANALFVTDVNKMMVDDPIESYRIARSQGAFIFWNHPHWIVQEKDGIPQLSDLHRKLIEEDLLHGLEVVNDLTFSEAAMQIANENDLVVIGTSDIHGLVDYQYEIANGGHRPVTLVFSEERSEDGIKEALFAGRTITWFNDILAGKQNNMELLIAASIIVEPKAYMGDSEVFQVELTNQSDARFYLNNTSVYDFHRNTDIIELEPHSSITLQVLRSRAEGQDIPLTFDILNAVVGYKEYYELIIELAG